MYCAEQNRQLSLEIWGKVYAEEMENLWQHLERLYEEIGKEPSIADYASFKEWLRAVEIYSKNRDVALNRIRSIPREKAEAAAIRGTLMSWSRIRKTVFERDGGICQVCGAVLSWDNWECGHIVDRCEGGSDRPSNLKVMCYWCNHLKPPHKTKAEYHEWVEVGAALAKTVARTIEALKAEGQIHDQMTDEEIKKVARYLYCGWLDHNPIWFDLELANRPHWQQQIDRIAKMIRTIVEERG